MKKIDNYWRHIIWVLLIKVILLSGIWFAFFSNEPKLTDNVVGNHVFN